MAVPTQPSFIPQAWASGTGNFDTIPATQQESGRASWDGGFPLENTIPVAQGGVPANYRDFQGVLNALSQFAVFQQSGGMFQWSADIDYPVGSIVLDSLGFLHQAIQESGPNMTAGVKDPAAGNSAYWGYFATVGLMVKGNIFRDNDVSSLAICGGNGVGNTNGARVVVYGASDPSTPGYINLTASDGTVSSVLSLMPNGQLSWAGKGFVFDTGDQTISGTKTFTTGVLLQNTNYEANVTPSTAQYITLALVDKNEVRVGAVQEYLNTNGARGLMLRLIPTDEAVVTTILSLSIESSNSKRITAYGDLAASPTNTLTCGTSSLKWSAVYAQTGTIQTSDRRLKENIANIPDAVLDAWGEINWQEFKFKDRIAAKGDAARTHVGIIAQDVFAAFTDHALDPTKYGLYCHDTWEAEDEQRDENGEIISPAVEAGDAFSIRYEEALAMEAAYQRRRADRLEERIARLEALIDGDMK